MKKLIKKFFWIFMIMLQTFLGIGVGMGILSRINVDTVLANTNIGQLPVGELSFEEAEAAINNYYNEQTKRGTLIIEIDQKLSALSYTDIDISVDINKTIENLKKSVPQNGFRQFFSRTKDVLNIQPVFTYNSGKLMTKCEMIFSPFERAATQERYEVEAGILKFIPQIPGRKVDYIQLEQELKERLFVQPQEKYSVNTQETTLFLESKGESLYKEPFTTLVSKYPIILEPGLFEKVWENLQSFNGVIFESGQEINLKDLIDFHKFNSDVEKDLLNRVATALYQSVLPIEGVTILNRKPSQRTVSYAESGLEAVIEGEGANLLLKNETEKPLMLLVVTANNTITLYMASTGELKSGIIIVQKKDRVPPPVITSVNRSLSPNQIKVIAEGVPGYTAYVSRIIDDERTELYHDQYQPVSRIVEAGENPIQTSSK